MSSAIERFVSDLAKVELHGRAVNQYSRLSGDERATATRRRNLRLYLHELAAIGPRVLLVGEAVSYRGGRLTGIAFVSETLMLSGVETRSGPVLGVSAGYRKATPGPKASTEASATMVWETIRQIDPLPLLWNAFPFHPFHAENPDSNRAPSASELLVGAPFLARLMRIYRFETVVAVGNYASLSLQRLEIQHMKVRHPSQGGKNLFLEGMARLSQSSGA